MGQQGQKQIKEYDYADQVQKHLSKVINLLKLYIDNFIKP